MLHLLADSIMLAGLSDELDKEIPFTVSDTMTTKVIVDVSIFRPK